MCIYLQEFKPSGFLTTLICKRISSRALNGDASRSRTLIALSSEDHVVVRTKLLSVLGPGIEVVLDSDGTTNALASPNRPVLLEGSSAVNGRLVGAGGLEDVVCATVRGDGTLLLSSRRGVVRAVGLDDVVLDERVASPSVKRDVGVYIGGVPGARVLDYLVRRTGVPSESQ